MNFNPETDLDLEKLFLPAWAQQPPAAHPYRAHEGEAEEKRAPRKDRSGARRAERPRVAPPGRTAEERRPTRERRPKAREAPAARKPEPLPEIKVAIVPDEPRVESLVRQIKATGRAYPLFEIARLILQKPERYALRFDVRKDKEGRVLQPLFVCALDDTLWLSEDDAVAHVLRQHFDTFYQAERTPTEPPKGKYTFVAQCGLSGVILGPPNYHDYQNRLHKLHAERFAHMPFDAYKAKVKIIRDEAIVKQWIEEQSWKTEYLCLNVPEPLRLPGREAVEEHFRATHKENIIKSVESHTIPGPAARALQGGLARLVHRVLAEQQRFPILVASALSDQFSRRGLQFFKVNRITHVAVARPRYLDLENMPVSEGVRRIVEFIRAHPGCTRRELIETLAPPPPIPIAPPAPGAETAAPTAPPISEPTPEQTAVIADLHWLIHQGHVIEFANGVLETAKKPAPKPPKPAPATAQPETPVTPGPSETPAEPEVVAGEASSSALARAEAAADAAGAEALVETSGPISEALLETAPDGDVPLPEAETGETPASANDAPGPAKPLEDPAPADEPNRQNAPATTTEAPLSAVETAPR
ncbi:MAG: hypothetical protein N3I86_09360 [Verrucomicrobiae bacterium]|nr:hypothetical protein [Verrucomicrobiae bacterium]